MAAVVIGTAAKATTKKAKLIKAVEEDILDLERRSGWSEREGGRGVKSLLLQRNRGLGERREIMKKIFMTLLHAGECTHT